MKNFFEPKSVAVIGASNSPEKVGNSLMKNLSGFKEEVIPINIHESLVEGKKAYKSVLDYPREIDLAIIAVPALNVKDVLIECGKKRIKSAIIISAGFREVGKSEDELLEVAKQYKIRLLGPNCFGTVNPYVNFDCTFALQTPDKGNIAFISQSGALWSALVEYSKERFGFSGYVSLGNMLDADFSDFIEYFNNDVNTKVIVCYIEELKNGRRFIEVCKRSKKPIIVLKAGRGNAGIRAVMSHTGSMAGEYEVYRAAFKQAKVNIAESFSELFDKAMFFEKQKLSGERVVIVTNGGGAGVLAADMCESDGLEVIPLNKKIIDEFNKKLPLNWSHNNPIDLVGDANYDRYKEVFNTLLKNPKEFDSVIVILTQQKMINVEKVAEEVISFKNKSGKAVVCAFMGGKEVEDVCKKLSKEGVLCFFDIKRVVRVLSRF